MPVARARKTAVVAGLGAMGGSVACHLAARGVHVVGLDAYRPPHTHGSSHGESRIIREAYFEHPSYVPLVRRAYEAWAELEREDRRPLLRVTGAILVGPPDGEAVAGARRSAEAHHIPHRLLNAAELRRELPVMRLGASEVALLEPRAGVLDPEACVAAHLRAAERNGADLRFGEPLVRWQLVPGGGIRAVTASAAYEADHLVLALGPWLPDLVPDLALEIERQVMVWFRPRGPASSFGPDRFPVFLWETDFGVFYGVPDLGAGLKAARHHGGTSASDVRALSPDVAQADLDQVRRFLERHIPAAAGEVVRSIVCRYTNTRDGHFLVDRLPTHPGVWIASACSGHGFKFSSVLGAALAVEMTTGQTDPDLGLFRWRTAVRRDSAS